MIINTIEEAEKFAKTAKVGSQWTFDGWPQPPTSDEEFEMHSQLEQDAVELLEKITAVIESAVAPKEPVKTTPRESKIPDWSSHKWYGLTAKQISKNKKADVVAEARAMGVETNKPNGKEDTKANIADRIVDHFKSKE